MTERAAIRTQVAGAPTRTTLSRRVFSLLGAYLLLCLVGMLTLLPFLWMVLGAFKTQEQLLAYPPRWIPDPWKYDNFAKVAQDIPLGNMFFNSVKITVLASLGALVSCSLAGYAFARLHFVGRDKLFIVLLATMMIPGQVTMIPIFIIMQRLGWIDTHYPLIVPDWFGWAFGIFLLRQFFLTISKEIEDAARIDGANPLQIFYSIFLPLSGPALATLAVFAFLGNWNDLLRPVIYLSTFEQMTLTVGLAAYSGRYWIIYERIMAGAVVSVIPIILIFLMAQKYFVRGVALSGGLKG